MGMLLQQAAQSKHPNLKHLNFERDSLPELPQKQTGIKKLVPLQNAHCETIDVKDGTPPPAPQLSKTAIHNLARDSNKQTRDDNRRSFICQQRGRDETSARH